MIKFLSETKEWLFHYNFLTKTKSPEPLISKRLRTIFLSFCSKGQVARLSRIIENFTSKVMKKFSQDNILSVDAMENLLWDASSFVREGIAAYAEMIDQLTLEQKKRTSNNWNNCL